MFLLTEGIKSVFFFFFWFVGVVLLPPVFFFLFLSSFRFDKVYPLYAVCTLFFPSPEKVFLFSLL